MRIKLLLLTFFLGLNGYAQFSKTHYIPPISNSEAYQSLEQALYISCPSTTNVNYKITALGGASTTGVVSRDNPKSIIIGNGSDTQILASEFYVGSVLNNKGYIVEADDLIYVTVRLTAINQAGGIVSKGLAALGTEYRIGAFTNNSPGLITDTRHYTFASVLATENNTVVTFSDIKPGTTLVNQNTGNAPFSITLNSGESYIIATQGPNNANRDGLIGALISSNKPIAVNCGSYGGSNGSVTNSSDFGFDQIVSTKNIGNEYIFIKGKGNNDVEKPLLVAHENGTEVFINGNTTPTAILNAGEYLAINGFNFTSDNNLYVKTSKNVFAYQGLGGSGNEANQNMHFVPPLSCETPKIINNIPKINEVGTDSNFGGTVSIVTKKGASLNFIINSLDYTLANLSNIGVSYTGPSNVTGNPDYVTYIFNGLSGNVSVFSSESVYLSYFGSSGFATYGGFYSGFTFAPEVAFQKVSVSNENCIPNIVLKVNDVTSFDQFQWYFNEVPITTGATNNSYTPTQPGFYHVKASISSCGRSFESDRIPVSSCSTNLDGDLANDNIDIDNDNDGITNCTESFGNQTINTAVTTGNIPNSTITYNTSYSTSTMAAAIPFTGNADGSFITEVPAGKGYFVDYTLNFSQPTNITLEYPQTAAASDLINSNAEYVVNSDINKTITVLNPSNQLLIDTNYDGIYESDVTQYSSFEIRFRLNGSNPLAAGSADFKFQSYQTASLKITHKNLSDTEINKSTFKVLATCVYKDTDSDGIPDQLDNDSDNDGISDVIEAQGNAPVILSNSDTNLNGLDNAFENGFIPYDNDNDSVPDYLDLDSDNDGILDSVEGIVDTDTDGIKNFRELDSDNDLCFDVKEAGFSDNNFDGILGDTTAIVNANGLVTNATGYTTPHPDYTTAAPITIIAQPTNKAQCLFETTTFEIDVNAETYQWQLSTDNGVNWSNISNDTTYSGTNTNQLTITNLQSNMNGFVYRVQLNRSGNSCDFYSNHALLTIYELPIVNSGVTYIQCDTDTNNQSIFNLRNKESQLSNNYANEKMDFFLTETGARNNEASDLITNPTSYENTSSPQTIWVRVTNNNNCFSVTSMELYVSTAGAITFPQPSDKHQCDDYVDAVNNDYDGIASFDFTDIANDLTTFLNNSNLEFKFYKNENDYYLENDVNGNSLAISDISNYRNIGYKDRQTIWIRIEDKITDACFGKPITFDVVVEPLPAIDTNVDKEDDTYICTNDANIYQTLTSGLPQNSNFSNYLFQWHKDGTPLNGENNPYLNVNEAGEYKVTVSNANGLQCSKERIITVNTSNTATLIGEPVVKDLTENNSISITVTGLGNYVFTLDDLYAERQTTGYFENVRPGLHTIYVLDLNGCPVLEVPVSITGFPQYFTPNGDGYHDHWNMIGASSQFNSKAKIYIFNRYGKLLKEINPLNEGWDGTYLGVPQPSDDYWYKSILEDGREVRGHFTLKR